MIYYILRPIVRIALKLYFKNIYIHGDDKIPHDKPIIFACNHPTAFMEPCMLACFLPIKLHFLVRGDLFSLKWLSWLLRGTNQIPIFRKQDAEDNHTKNLVTEKILYKLFQQNHALLMCPEGHTHENIYIKPIKKGIARFALMDHNTDLQIIPIGVNFDKNVRTNSKASIVVGTPISVKTFKELKFDTFSKQVKALADIIFTEMKTCARHIENIDREETIHKYYSIVDSNRRLRQLPIVQYSNDIFQSENDIAKKLDTDIHLYSEIDKILKDKTPTKIKKTTHLDLLVMIMLLPLLGVSLIINMLPMFVSKLVVKNKIDAHEFKSPVFLSMMLLQYLILIIILFIAGITINSVLLYILIAICLIGVLGNIINKFFEEKWRYLFAAQSERDVIKLLHNKSNIPKIIHNE